MVLQMGLWEKRIISHKPICSTIKEVGTIPSLLLLLLLLLLMLLLLLLLLLLLWRLLLLLLLLLLLPLQ
jgi:hypothetical protein